MAKKSNKTTVPAVVPAARVVTGKNGRKDVAVPFSPEFQPGTTAKLARPDEPNVGEALIGQTRRFVERFVTFPIEGQSHLVALWIVGSWLADLASVYPYLAVTARTSGAGKTTLLRCVRMLSHDSVSSVGGTLAYFLAKIKAGGAPDVLAPMNADGTRAWSLPMVTLALDESEGGGGAVLGQFFRSGYKQGDIIGKTTTRGGVVEHQAYCPKAFALIGNLPRLLRDRSILCELVRVAKPAEDLIEWEIAPDADAIKAQIMVWRRRILAARAGGARVRLWSPDDRMTARAREVFAAPLGVAKLLDLTPATMDAIYHAIEASEAQKDAAGDVVIRVDHDAEKRAAEHLRSWKLLQDAASVTGELPTISGEGLRERLTKIQLGGYARLTPEECARMLSRYGIAPKVLRVADRPKVTETETTVKARNAKGEPVKVSESQKTRHPLARGYDAVMLRKVAAEALATGQEAYLRQVAERLPVEGDTTVE